MTSVNDLMARMTPDKQARFLAENPHLRDLAGAGATVIPPKAANGLESPPLAASTGVQRADLADSQARFLDYCEGNGLPLPIAEYRFAAPRRFRADFAWLEERLILEVQGGIWTQGRHTRGAALLSEWEKLNLAAGMGYRFLFCQPKELCTQATVDAIRAALRWGCHRLSEQEAPDGRDDPAATQ